MALRNLPLPGFGIRLLAAGACLWQQTRRLTESQSLDAGNHRQRSRLATNRACLLGAFRAGMQNPGVSKSTGDTMSSSRGLHWKQAVDTLASSLINDLTIDNLKCTIL